MLTGIVSMDQCGVMSNTAYPFANINPGGPQATLVVVGAMTVYTRAPSQLIKFMTMVTAQTGWPLC